MCKSWGLTPDSGEGGISFQKSLTFSFFSSFVCFFSDFVTLSRLVSFFTRLYLSVYLFSFSVWTLLFALLISLLILLHTFHGKCKCSGVHILKKSPPYFPLKDKFNVTVSLSGFPAPTLKLIPPPSISPSTFFPLSHCVCVFLSDCTSHLV